MQESTHKNNLNETKAEIKPTVCHVAENSSCLEERRTRPIILPLPPLLRDLSVCFSCVAMAQTPVFVFCSVFVSFLTSSFFSALLPDEFLGGARDPARADVKDQG